MSVQVASKGTEPSIPTQIDIKSNSTGKTVSLLGGFVEMTYTESIMSDSIKVNYTFIDSGQSIDGKSVRDGLPLVGEERVTLKFEDNSGNKIGDKKELVLYVNKITPIDNQSQKSVLNIDLVSKEYILNEKKRVKERYDGKPSEHVRKVCQNILKTEKDLYIEETVNNLNVLGNVSKPFYFINNLARKGVSAEHQTLGKTAGYFFYETSEGFYFKSVDGLLNQEPKVKTIYNETPDTGGGGVPEGKDFKTLNYLKKDNVNVKEKMRMGALSSRMILFDPFNCYYEVKNPRTDETEGSLKTAGRDGLALKKDLRNKEFDQEGTNADFTRTTYYLLDKGSLPTGDTDQQISKSEEENYTYADITNQAFMRYNQFFSSMADITIPGNFALHAGDMIHLDVPGLDSKKTSTPDDKDSGLYIITDICHTISSESTFTRCNLSRDSIGRKPVSR